MRLKKRHQWMIGGLLASLFALALFWQWGAEDRARRKAEEAEIARVEKIQKSRAQLNNQLGPYFLSNNYPDQASMLLNGKNDLFRIEYTFDLDLQKEAERLLKSYKPDYGALVILNADTGQILALANTQKGKAPEMNLALRGTYPAASIFKIITASAAIDKYKVSPDTLIFFNGGNHTLYKKNAMFTKPNRWTRGMTLREAFARSINTVFSRLTFEKMEPKDIEEYAIRFGFNKRTQTDLPFDVGFTEVPQEKTFRLAEIASGFNRVTRMSPIQGAMIAASVATNGVMPVPYAIENVKDSQGKVVFQSQPVTAAVTMTAESASHLQDLMEATVHTGTSRKSFRDLVRNKKFHELILGGKTGSLTGDNPRGKVDWFVGYAIGGEHDRLAIAAITVNVNYWTVKSSYLAQSLFKTHFKNQFSEKNQKFFNTSAEVHE